MGSTCVLPSLSAPKIHPLVATLMKVASSLLPEAVSQILLSSGGHWLHADRSLHISVLDKSLLLTKV